VDRKKVTEQEVIIANLPQAEESLMRVKFDATARALLLRRKILAGLLGYIERDCLRDFVGAMSHRELCVRKILIDESVVRQPKQLMRSDL
jgi:hypothetical protein